MKFIVHNEIVSMTLTYFTYWDQHYTIVREKIPVFLERVSCALDISH